MKTLRLVNFLIAILGMAGCFCIFFIKRIDLSSIFISAFLFIMFSLFGVEKIIDKREKARLYLCSNLSGYLFGILDGGYEGINH